MNAQGRNFVTTASPKTATGKYRLSLSQAFGLSLTLHLALAAPLVLLSRPNQDNPPETLAVDLDGLLADRQDEAKSAKEAAPPQQAEAPAPEQPREAEQVRTPPATPPQKQEAPEDASDTPPPQQQPITRDAEKARETPPPPPGALAPSLSDEGQVARTLSRSDDKEDALRKYGARLIKRVQSRLIVPKEERASGAQGEVKVSFAIAADGTVAPASLRVVASSGRPALDAAALATVTRSAPFPPPPEADTFAFTVYFGKK